MNIAMYVRAADRHKLFIVSVLSAGILGLLCLQTCDQCMSGQVGISVQDCIRIVGLHSTVTVYGRPHVAISSEVGFLFLRLTDFQS